MTEQRYLHFCQRLASALMSDDLGPVVEFYHHPHAIYSTGSVRVELSKQETIDSVAMLQSRARSEGATRIVPELRSVKRSEDGRAVLHLNWNYVDERDAQVAQSVMRFYCREHDTGDLRIEIVEFEVMAYPEIPGTGPKRRDH